MRSAAVSIASRTGAGSEASARAPPPYAFALREGDTEEVVGLVERLLLIHEEPRAWDRGQAVLGQQPPAHGERAVDQGRHQLVQGVAVQRALDVDRCAVDLERVEDAQLFGHLVDLGTDDVQGFAVALPRPLAEIFADPSLIPSEWDPAIGQAGADPVVPEPSRPRR